MSPINIQPPSPTALPCKVAELAKCAKKEFSPHFHLPNTYPMAPTVPVPLPQKHSSH